MTRIEIRPPPIWGLLCGILAVPDPLAKRVWLALATCAWSEVQDWRRRLLVSEHVGDPAQLARDLFAPAEIVRVLELLHQARRQVVAQAQLQRATGKAVMTLIAVMDDPEAPHAAKVTAARTILEQAIRAIELDDLEARIQALEQAR